MKTALTVFLIFGAALLSAPAATVTSLADSGPGSLRDAIASAAPGETINFAVTGTITLTSGELAIGQTLTIAGPGATNLLVQRSTASGTADFRIFDAAGTVVISGVTVSNGRDDSGMGGGGIFNESDLTLNDCVVIGNFAALGGGLANYGTMTVSNCVFQDNSAVNNADDGLGGGIYNFGEMDTINCRVSSNSVTSGPGNGLGGGIENDGTLTVTLSTITGNSAIGGTNGGSGFGGGLANDVGTVYVNTSTVSGNNAVGGNSFSAGGLGEGGGVANDLGTVMLERTTLSGNNAAGGEGFPGGGPGEGGGVANNDGTVYVDSSTVSRNLAGGGTGTSGGGLADGGGIFNGDGSVAVTYSTIASNAVPGGSQNAGGGIYNDRGAVVLDSTIVAANVAQFDLFDSPGGGGFTMSIGYNLIGSMASLFMPGPGDLTNVTAAAVNLGPLQDNGGPTFTHALLCGSLALGAGDLTDAPATDQRGFPRVVNGTVDIGAYESGNTPPTISCSAPFNNCIPGATVLAATFSANVADADGDPLVVVWSVDGAPVQTNTAAAASPPTSASVTVTVLLGVGAHEITAAVSDPSECVATCATAVTLNPNPTVTAGNNGPVCESLPLVLSARSTPATGVNFSWRGPNGFVSTQQNPMIPNATPAASGPYTVTVTDANGCTASAMTAVTVNASPAVTATNNGPVSAGATLKLTASSATAVSFSWSGPNSFASTARDPAISNVTTAASGTYTVTVTDANGCTASATTTVMVTAPGGGTNLYPIALSQKTIAGVAVGAVLPDIYNGAQAGNFGWLTWAGSPSEPTLVASLTPPGNSRTYINPQNPKDHIISVGDWVQGKPGVTNSKAVRDALDALKTMDIIVPVWDQARGAGNNSLYRVSAFARVRLISYQLPAQNRITARFLGFVAGP